MMYIKVTTTVREFNSDRIDSNARGEGPFGHGEITRTNKVRITIHLDGDIVSYFKGRATKTAKGYQTLINDALREYADLTVQPSLISDLVERVKRLEEKLLRRPAG
jgi:uncharacterized protein (DUF4415 family)